MIDNTADNNKTDTTSADGGAATDSRSDGKEGAALAVRVRYAPSPTGMQHIGGIRTALFNYFFARAHRGTFILRIEDTDRTRFHPDALEDIYQSFAWLGITADESPAAGGSAGPYVQSMRLELYREHADRLVAAGRAYWDYTSAAGNAGTTPEDSGNPTETTSENSGEATTADTAPYDYQGRNLSEEAVQRYREAGVTPVLRLLVPEDGETVFQDLVLGRIRRKHKDLPPDPILMKSDGFPTYHLANVVDDHLMGITHVLRAQEWVPSTPLHLLIYQAFGWEPPQFAHLPMVMGKDGSKLSKRHGSTSLIEFRKAGYLPEAVINYVSLLGWSYDDSREFFSREDLERLFSAERINKAPAVFDYRKLEWFNGQYIRELATEKLADMLLPWIQEEQWAATPPTEQDRERLASRVPLIRERLKVLADVVPLLRFVYVGVSAWQRDELIPRKAEATEAATWLSAAWAVVCEHGTDDEELLDNAFRHAAETHGTKLGNLLMPLRVAVTGSTVSPPLVGSIREIGVEEAGRRVSGALRVLQGGTGGPDEQRQAPD